MAKSAWTTLTDSEKDDLVRRRYNIGEDIESLAEELDMYGPTLDRRIREWRQLRGEKLADAVFEKEEEPDSEEFTKKVEGNNMEVIGPPGRILSLEDLLKACDVDLEEWEVDRYVVNKWEVGRKQTEKDLVWENGVVNGYTTDTGKMHVEPLFQVKAWLVRKKPIEIFPTVQPISLNLDLAQVEHRLLDYDRRPYHSTLVIPDIHVGFYRDFYTGEYTPFHDRGVLSVILSSVYNLQPDTIIFLGDNLDLPDWSDKFIRSPEFRNVTQPAIDEMGWWLAQFRSAAMSSHIVYIEGNHENRMYKARQTNMIAAFDIRQANRVEDPPALTIPYLLDLKSMSIDWVGDYPDGEYWISNDLVAKHGDRARAGSGDSAKAMLANHDVSVIFGHIHRMEFGIKTITTRKGVEVVRAVSPGCVCRIDGTVPGHVKSQNWSNGFAMVYSYKDGDNIVPIEVVNGRAQVEGISYRAEEQDYTELLRKDLGHWVGI